MQTSRESTIILAGEQIPLLTAEQLQPGVILTGIAMAHAWRIHARREDFLELQKLPVLPLSVCETHQYSVVGRGQHCSRCQLRRQAVAEFLPRTADKPRVYLLQPRGALQPPQPYTLYGYMQGNTLKTVSCVDAQWTEILSLIPALHIVWTIPDALRSLLGPRTVALSGAQQAPAGIAF